MFKNILVAYDGSPESARALRAGIAMARCMGADLTALTVDEASPVYAHVSMTPEVPLTEAAVTAYEEKREAFGERHRAEARQMAEIEGITIRTAVVMGREVEGIVAYAAEHGCDLLVIGHHKHSPWEDRLWGSTTQRLHCSAPCSLMLVQ